MIQTNRSLFLGPPVERACALLDLDRSGFYRFVVADAPPVEPLEAENETALREAIENIVVEFAGYGYRRVTAQLARDGWRVNQVTQA